MENNRYAQHKKEIQAISEKENVDIGVACAILRHEQGWTFESTDGVDREIMAFTRFVHDLDPKERAAYFAE